MIFIDRYKWPDVENYYCQFLKKIEVIKTYLVKFEENSFKKSKVYLNNYIIKSLNW